MSGMLYSIPVILTGYRIVQIEDERHRLHRQQRVDITVTQ